MGLEILYLQNSIFSQQQPEIICVQCFGVRQSPQNRQDQANLCDFWPLLLFRLPPEACKRRSYYLDRCPAVHRGTVVFFRISSVTSPWVFPCEFPLSLLSWEGCTQSMIQYIHWVPFLSKGGDWFHFPRVFLNLQRVLVNYICLLWEPLQMK